MQTVSTPTSIAHPCSRLAGPASAPDAAWLGTGWGWGACKSSRRCRFIKELRLIFMWPARTPGVQRQRGRESVGMNCGLFCWGEKGITLRKKNQKKKKTWLPQDLMGNCPPLNTSDHFLPVLQPPVNLSCCKLGTLWKMKTDATDLTSVLQRLLFQRCINSAESMKPSHL